MPIVTLHVRLMPFKFALFCTAKTTGLAAHLMFAVLCNAISGAAGGRAHIGQTTAMPATVKTGTVCLLG